MIQFLQLMQMSDSAIPIGAASHSFGLESLAEWGDVHAETLDALLKSYLQEQALLEACYCRTAYTIFSANEGHKDSLSLLCRRLSSTRPAKESRDGSISLGRRLLAVCSSILKAKEAQTLGSSFQDKDPHHVIVFGALAATLGFNEDLAVAAFLQQTVAALISAAQRLMPVGQRQAAAAQWGLKEDIVNTVERSRDLNIFSVGSFMPMSEIASMRHPRLETRLFLS